MTNNILASLVALFVVPVLTTALYKCLSVLAEKAHVQINKEQDDQLRMFAKEAAIATEEWAMAMVKDGTAKPDATEKHDEAINRIVDAIPDVTAHEAELALLAALPQLGLGAFGKSKG